MGPSGSSDQIGGAQSVPPSLLRSNSGLMAAQPSQASSYPSLVSPRTQFNSANMLGNFSNLGFSGPGCSGAESDPLNGLGFNNMVNPGSAAAVQGQQFSNPSGSRLLPDQQSAQQLEPLNFQQGQQNFQPQQFRGGLSGVGTVKLDPQAVNDSLGQQQPLQNMRNLGRNFGPVKMEPQNSDQSLFFHQQQQQQFNHISRIAPQAASILQQQRILQMQQQQQLLKTMPQQRPQLPQNLPLRSPVKPVYEPGMCARRVTHYMYQQQHRPEDNNINFWRKFVAEYFAHNAKKRWCVSMYGNGRQTTGVFPQDALRCEICNRRPGRGFEATVEVLPRLFKIKYESGTMEELLYVDMPREYQNSSGQIVLDYAKAIQESVFHQLRVVRDGQLRIVFSPDLKIVSWEFCAWRHDELIPRRLLIPQVTEFGAVAQKCQPTPQNASSNLSTAELQSNCNTFVASARKLAKALEVPLVNDLGYTKRYVRCLQISEVVNSMKDLIDYSRITGTGPMESLTKFPRRTSSSCGPRSEAQQPGNQQHPHMQGQMPHQQQQQPVAQKSNNDQSSVLATAVQLASNNGITSVNNSINIGPVPSTSTGVGLLHQNSMKSRQSSSINNAGSPYGGNSVQMPSPGPTSAVLLPQSSPTLQAPVPSLSSNPQPSDSANQVDSPLNSLFDGADDTNEQQSSVEKILKEIMSSQLNPSSGSVVGVGSLGSDVKSRNGTFPAANTVLTGGTGLVGNNLGFGTVMNGMRGAMDNTNSTRIGMNSMAREQSLNHQHDILGELGAINGFDNIQFDWKSSP
ncbi:hypothetical protein ACFE04_025815 [Oxalis oulophora]